ncbi:MAG TPA: 50S ribosomal protein L25/general stress protein Ctc [Actinomycetes bacterium]|nr:50S ribosomal protein L25/general stress protein Ctc [Actinomycetes bacterium]
MSEIAIDAERRTEFGKGAARRLRRDKKVPVVVYGHGEDTQHLALPAHDLMLALKQSNALLSLKLDGDSQLVLPKAVQRDPVRHTIEHVDLVAVRTGEKVTVEVLVKLEGKIAPGGLLEHVNDTITIEAEATNIPAELVVSVEGLEVGSSVHASDVELPQGVELVADPETVVIHVLSAQQAAAEMEEIEAAAAAEAAEAAGVPEAGEEAAPAAETPEESA